jgi:hypothetical protein
MMAFGERGPAARLGALRCESAPMYDHQPDGRTWRAKAVGWALLGPLASLIDEELPEEPKPAVIAAAPVLGAEGLFLARAIAELYRTHGRSDVAIRLERTLATACQQLGIDVGEGDGLLERFRRARR